MAQDAASFLAVHRTGVADEQVEAAVRHWQSVQEERVYDGLPERWGTPRTRRVVRLWTAHVLTLCLDRLDDPGATSRDQVVDHCLHLFRNSLARAVDSA